MRANQKRGVKDVLWVDKKFRTYGPEDHKEEYHKTSNRSYARVQHSSKQSQRLEASCILRLVQRLCLVLNRKAAQNVGRTDKAVSPTYFNT